MDQRQILLNRTVNYIEILRHQIKKNSEIELYNDLLILKVIVQQLPKSTLRNLLKEFKPHNINPSADQNRINFKFNLSRIMRVLNQEQKPSPLLSDFLICAGYTKKPLSCTS